MPIRRRRRQDTTNAVTAGATLTSDPGAAVARSYARVTALYLSPDHSHLAVLRRGELTIYRLDDERIGEQVAESREGSPLKMAWSGSGQLLAFLNRDMQAEILNPGDGTSLNLGDATAVAFYPDGSHVAVMGDTSVAVWQVNPLIACDGPNLLPRSELELKPPL